jgi:RNA polymerase sigma-70 factor (ECF subfamily)
MSKDLTNISDAELYYMLSGSKSESKTAFEELYRRYSPNIYTYCRKVLNNDPMAEDVFQETFMRFYSSAKKKKDRKMTNVAGYLIKIARNLCLNEKAKKYNDKVSLEDLELPHYDKSYGNRQLNELLQTALDALPKKYREVIVLREYMDMSYKEIAEALDTTMPIVRIRIYRAKGKIKELLAPYFDEIKDYS